MSRTPTLTAVLLTILLTACNSGGDETGLTSTNTNHVWKEQMKILEKAREVEKKVLAGAEQRQRTIDRLSE